MSEPAAAVRAQMDRQVGHWALAVSRLDLDDLAAPEAWNRLEQYLGLSLRRHLDGVIGRLRSEVGVLVAMKQSAPTVTGLAELRRKVLLFRRQYVRTETTLDFFADAINSRTNPRIAGLLRACDTLAYRAMSQLLDPLGKATPPALTYLDKGLGASILKAGMRLWDGGDVCPVAAVKVTRQNLLRPTSLIHEAGHQVAHITGWNEELAAVLRSGLTGASSGVAGPWAGWSSEIAADAFAFAHTGYASVAALHDVLSGDEGQAFRHIPGDPHPISFLRVLLGVEMCRYFYGAGPWDNLASAWTMLHPLNRADGEGRDLALGSLPHLNGIVKLTLDTPMASFGGCALRQRIPPERVSLAALDELQQRIGPALYTSAHWLWTEPLRMLALTGAQLDGRPAESERALKMQEESMLRLGGAMQAA